jgi:hypothetical protein
LEQRLGSQFLWAVGFLFVAAGATLGHFLFGPVHLLMAAQAALVIGAQQGGRDADRLIASRMTRSALRNVRLRLQGAEVMAARANGHRVRVKVLCQFAAVAKISQFLGDRQMRHFGGVVLMLNSTDLELVFHATGKEILGGGQVHRRVKRFESP